MKLLKYFGFFKICFSVFGIALLIFAFYGDTYTTFYKINGFFRKSDIHFYVFFISVFFWILFSGIAFLKKSIYLKSYSYINLIIFFLFSAVFAFFFWVEKGKTNSSVAFAVVMLTIALLSFTGFILTVFLFFYKPAKEHIDSHKPDWKLNFHPVVFLLAIFVFSFGHLVFFLVHPKFYSSDKLDILNTDLYMNNPQIFEPIFNMVDKLPETCSKVTPSSGENAIIDIPIPEGIFVSGIEIHPGSPDKPDTKENELLWFNRISEITIESIGGEKKTFALKDENKIQKLEFGPWNSANLKITINRVKPGSAFQSLCISHLHIFKAMRLFQ